jgi:hypothetical protein
VLAAVNDGEDSYILDTRTGKKQALAPTKRCGRNGISRDSEIRATIGDPLWHALYMQRPSLGKRKFSKPTTSVTAKLRVDRVICAWDTASRVEDRTRTRWACAGATPEGNSQLLDVVRGR